MILHKYLDQCYNILSDLELKVSIPSELNDPFEFTAAYPEELTSIEIKNYFNSINFKELTWLRKQIGHIQSNFSN